MADLDKSKLEDGAEQVKGKAKEYAGKVTGDEGTDADKGDGMMDKAKETFDKTKEKVKQTID